MAKRGPKPKPKELKIASGTRADRINPDAPLPLPGRPKCPPNIEADPVALAEWHHMVELLEKMGVLSTTDAAALALYCSCYSRWNYAEDKIRTQGMTTTTAHGGTKVSPFVAISNAAIAQMQKLLVEFGCTPSSRSRVNHTDVGKPKSKLEQLLAKKRAR